MNAKVIVADAHNVIGMHKGAHSILSSLPCKVSSNCLARVHACSKNGIHSFNLTFALPFDFFPWAAGGGKSKGCKIDHFQTSTQKIRMLLSYRRSVLIESQSPYNMPSLAQDWLIISTMWKELRVGEWLLISEGKHACSTTIHLAELRHIC